MIKVPASMRGRLMMLVLSGVMSIWLATLCLSWIDARHELEELLDGHLAQAAALLVVQHGQEIENDDHDIDAPQLHRYAPKVAFQVFHRDHLELRSSNAPHLPMLPNNEQGQAGFFTAHIDGIEWRVFSARGSNSDIHVYVGEQTSSRSAILWALMKGSLWPLLIGLPVLTLAVWWAVHLGVAPLRRLGLDLSQRDPQTLDPVQLDNTPSEMRPMMAALNGLFQRIAQLMQSERRFTADAAHELRTPIAAIRTHAQVAMGESDQQLRQHALKQTLEGCDRATRLIEQLLVLSRLDAGTMVEKSSVNLASITQQVLASLAPKALGKQQTLELVMAPHQPSSVNADEMLLSILIRNLIDNAVRYCPPQATVRVSITGPSHDLQLSIEDSGPGLPEPDLNNLGQRFFRVLGTTESGSGLGWSIVRRIAEVNGWSLKVERCEDLGGLATHVRFH